jgi:uncharacterized protein YqfB (UPF0267 family)
MIIGFKEQFVRPILAKTKKHTIREDSHSRWKTGMKMHMATGVRTKKYHQFNEETVKSIQEIEIITFEFAEETIVRIDGQSLRTKEIRQLAQNDGFESLFDFYVWFINGFRGKIIHWTDLRY